MIFNFTLFSTIKDEKLFSKENDFRPNGGKWFPFWEDMKLILFLQLFDDIRGWNLGAQFNFNSLDQKLTIR